MSGAFARVGASDDLARGRSTFMMEMIETSAILHQAGSRALVVLDEIGRGTATFDGLAIAWATAEHLHDTNKCRAVFATHYHELTVLADRLQATANAHLRAKEWKGDLVFLHEVAPGAADRDRAHLVGIKRRDDLAIGVDALGKALGRDVTLRFEKTTNASLPTPADLARSRKDANHKAAEAELSENRSQPSQRCA